MRFFTLYRVELRRLALSQFTWVFAALCTLGPLLGFSYYRQSMSDIMSGRYVANPALAAAVIGAVIWAVLTLLENDRVYHTKTDVLIDAVVSPIRMAVIRFSALITLSTLSCLICAVIYLPYTISKMDYLFDLGLYFSSYLILVLPTWWISILIVAALYQITHRIQTTGILYAACVYFSMSHFVSRDFFARWINPLISTYSDGFSSSFYLRIALYTRILWLALAGGFWLLSLICIRRYQKNLAGSFWNGLRKFYIPLVSIALLSAGTLLWIRQPFVDHGPAEWQNEREYLYGSNNQATVLSVIYRLTAKPSTGRLHGIAEYVMTTKGVTENSIALNPGYKIKRITFGDEELKFETLSEIKFADERRTLFTIPEGKAKTLVIEYEGYPTMLRCFAPGTWGNEVNADYVSLSNAGSVPTDTSFALPQWCTVELTIPEKLTPIIEHQLLTEFTENGDGTKTWQIKGWRWYSYLWITACDYVVEPLNANGINVNFIYSRKHEKNMKEYKIPEAFTEVLNYCTENLGKLYWFERGRLMLLERSAIMGGGNAGDGWVEWGEGTFAANNLNDPLKGANAAEVFAHEMIHQWWGGLGVECGSEMYDNIWSNEGLTVYTTYRLMKEKYGELYAKQYYVDTWQAAVDAQERGFYYRHPEYLDRLPGTYRAMVNIKSWSTNHYQRMPLMILKAEKLVGGEEKFDEILRTIQKKYANNGFNEPFTYQDFLDECGLRREDLELE